MISIRRAVPEDAPVISELAAEVQRLHAVAHPTVFKPAGAETFPPEVIVARIATTGHHLWVAVANGVVVGYVYATALAEPETAWRYAATVVTLDQMGVAARYRGGGAGSRLVAAVRDMAKALGATDVRLNVWTFNADARAFYLRCGFVAVQERLWLSIGGDGAANAPLV